MRRVLNPRMRLSIRSLILAAAGAVVLHAGATPVRAQGTAGRVDLDRIVAVVGTGAITLFDLQERINTMRQEGAPVPTDSAAYLAFARDVLNQMVDDEVLVQKA